MAPALVQGDTNLNINELHNIFFEVHDILIPNLLDLLYISETNWTLSFPNVQYRVPGFKNSIVQTDWNTNGGGIAAYIGNDLPHCRRSDLESKPFLFNTLRPRQNDRHFPDDIFICIFLNENV